MKNKLLIISLLSIALASCGSQGQKSNSTNSSNGEVDISSLSIMTPVGAPALGFYGFATYQNFETNSSPANIQTKMNAAQKDVIVLPTNAGVKLIGQGAPYKLAATITFGNFFVASLNNDDNQVMDANDTILLFQKNNVPDKLFRYVYGDTLNSAIHYTQNDAIDDAKQAVIDGEFTDSVTGTKMVPNYVLLAEPALTAVKAKVSVYANIQEEYRNKSNNLDIYQASVFIKNSLEADKANAFLDKLKSDIEGAIADPSKLSAGMNKVESPATVFGVPSQLAENVLRNGNGMGLGFKKAKDNKAGIDRFLALFNFAETNEEIYF